MPRTWQDFTPPTYTHEQLQAAIELASQGKPFREIIDQALLMSEFQFWLYRKHHLDFANSFEQARQEGLEHLADGLMTAHDDYVDVQRARLKSDNAKWLLSKRKPEIYGDKVDIHVSQTIDITGALADARARALGPSRPKEIDVAVSHMSPKENSEQDQGLNSLTYKHK